MVNMTYILRIEKNNLLIMGLPMSLASSGSLFYI